MEYSFPRTLEKSVVTDSIRGGNRGNYIHIAFNISYPFVHYTRKIKNNKKKHIINLQKTYKIPFFCQKELFRSHELISVIIVKFGFKILIKKRGPLRVL